MSTTVNLGGVSHSIPAKGESSWSSLSAYLIAISSKCLQTNGGTWTLLADISLSGTYGLKAPYYKSQGSNISTTGIVRLANAESVAWRNNANGADIALKVNASDRLEIDGVNVPTISSTDTLTNKTLTSPVINTPTGIVKGDVGLGNVDNTSDATKDAATATLTNKTLTSPVINSPTGLVKADVGLGNVDNTSDATKNAASAILTNKTITAPIIDHVDLTQETTPSAPASGKSRVYVNSADGKLHVQNSAGTDVAVGSGSSGRNYMSDWFDSSKAVGTITNSIGDTLSSSDRSANKTNWGSSNTSFLTFSDTTTESLSSSALREGKSYVFKHVGAGVAFLESPLTTLDAVDLGKPITLSLDVSGVLASDDYQVYVVRYNSSNILQERIPVAGTASATSPYSARIPTGTSKFQGFFIAGSTSTDQYAIRFVRLAGTNNVFADSLYVGPQSVTQGAGISDWVSYTPTFASVTASAVAVQYARVGNSIRVKGSVTCGSPAGTTFSISLPARLAIDSTGLTNSKTKIGEGIRLVTGGTSALIYSDNWTIFFDTATNSNLVYFAASAGSTAFVKAPASGIVANTDAIAFEFEVPIVGWSSNVTMADRAVEEYASNTNGGVTAGSSYTTQSDTSNSPLGAAIGSIASTTANSVTTYRSYFNSAIQKTDSFVLEVDRGSSGASWFNVGNSGHGVAGISQGTSFYGISIDTIGSNYVDVIFGNQGTRPSNATYAGSSGTAWSVYAAWRWRVRKVSGGSSVGFPINSSNLVGDVSGVTAPSGYLGEIITATSSTALTSSYANLCTITLTPGTWDMTALASLNGATGNSYIDMAISANTGSMTGVTYGLDGGIFALYSAGGVGAGCIPRKRVVITTSTTYYLVAKSNSGTVACASSITAVRAR